MKSWIRIPFLPAFLLYGISFGYNHQTTAHFGYHPVYLSRLLPKLFGKTFLPPLDIRMKKAKILLDHTDLTIEKIAAVLGYSNSSNFYKSFRHYYGKSPRSLS